MQDSSLSTEKLDFAANKLKAIAHPVRIAIIELLKGDNRLNVTQIYIALNIEQAAASHHLNILRINKILVAKREGKNIFYSLKYSTLSDIITCINHCNND